MTMPKELPEGLTMDRVMEAAKRQMFDLDNPGFCLACGAEREGCEPDARNYECWECGEEMVFGAEEVLFCYA